MTAKSRDAMAAPAIKVRVTMRSNDAELATVAGENVGRGYAVDMDSVERAAGFVAN